MYYIPRDLFLRVKTTDLGELFFLLVVNTVLIL